MVEDRQVPRKALKMGGEREMGTRNSGFAFGVFFAVVVLAFLHNSSKLFLESEDVLEVIAGIAATADSGAQAANVDRFKTAEGELEALRKRATGAEAELARREGECEAYKSGLGEIANMLGVIFDQGSTDWYWKIYNNMTTTLPQYTEQLSEELKRTPWMARYLPQTENEIEAAYHEEMLKRFKRFVKKVAGVVCGNTDRLGLDSDGISVLESKLSCRDSAGPWVTEPRL